MDICMRFGSTESDLSQRAGDRNTGRAECGKQAADCPHERGKHETTKKECRSNSKLKCQFAEARHVHGASGQPMHRKGDETSEDTTDQCQSNGFRQKRGDDARSRESER